MSLITRILVPTDGSAGALAAARYAARLAAHTGASVTLLHVVEQPRMPRYALTAAAARASLTRELVEAGKAILTLTQGPFAHAGIPVVTELCAGPPADTITATAAHGRYDLIVIGANGADAPICRSLGGVSHQVARRAACPVLLVGPRGRP